MDWRVIGSSLLLVWIFYMLMVPTRSMIEKRKKLSISNNKRVSSSIKQNLVFQHLIVTGVNIRRHTTFTTLTNTNNQYYVSFNMVSTGQHSETIYVLVSSNGIITQFPTEILAQKSYVEGDYGIIAITMEPGVIHQRSIVPDGIDKANSFTIELSLMVLSK